MDKANPLQGAKCRGDQLRNARASKASKYALLHAQHLEVYHVKWYVWEPGADELNSTNIPLIEGEAGWAG